MFIFYVYRREQERIRASTNRENESIESTQQRFVYFWMLNAYFYANKNVFVYFSFNNIFLVHRRVQERVRASTNRENESTESTQQRFVYLWMLNAYLYANKNVFVYFSFNNIFFMFIDVNKSMFVHLQIERMNPLNLHNKGLFIFECYMFIFMLTKNVFVYFSFNNIFLCS